MRTAGRTTVLLAEHDEAVRTRVTQLLGTEGYLTLEARDGAEALCLVQRSLPELHLVITDVMTPMIDGLELGRRVARCCAELPVLYTSSHLQGDVFHRDGPGPHSRFLQKPFSDGELLAKVRVLIAASPTSTSAAPRAGP